MKDLLDVEIIEEGAPRECANLESLPLAYAYVPYQNYEQPYDMEKSLNYGTAFPSLNKPYGVYGKEFDRGAGASRL